MAPAQNGFRTINFAGREFRLSDLDGADLVAAQMEAGGYEAPLPMLLSAVVARTEHLFLDVGANNGLYSILAATTRPTVQVVAFEPYLPVLDVLRSNIAANGLEARVQVMDCALSDKDGRAALFIPDASHGLLETSSSLERDFVASSEAGVSVPIKRLDDIELPGRVSVVKVDIEGHEVAFLRGGAATIQRDRPIIFAEMLHAARFSFYEISKMMSSWDYNCFRLRSDVAILEEFIRYDSLAWNWGLFPREKTDMFREICRFHNVDIVKPF